MKKYAFITGANKGIGYELVRQLAEKDYHVFLGARNEQLGQQAVESFKCFKRFLYSSRYFKFTIHSRSNKENLRND